MHPTPSVRRLPTRLLVLIALAVTLAASLPAAAGDDPYAMSEAEGAAGPCRLGAPAPRALAIDGDGWRRSADGAVRCREEAGRGVVEIRVTSPLYYTREHLLRVGSATVGEVVKALGSPVASGQDPETGGLVLTYPRLRAHFPRAADRRAQLSARLSRIDLVIPGGDG